MDIFFREKVPRTFDFKMHIKGKFISNIIEATGLTLTPHMATYDKSISSQSYEKDVS